MRKENILVMVLVGLALLGAWSFFSNGSIKTAPVSETTPAVSGSGSQSSSDIAFKSYSEGMALAKSSNRQVFLYFYADW